MNAFFRLIPIIFKYLVNLGPLVYEATMWGIKVVREIRAGKTKKPAEVAKPETIHLPVEEFPATEASPTAKPDLDPG